MKIKVLRAEINLFGQISKLGCRIVLSLALAFTPWLSANELKDRYSIDPQMLPYLVVADPLNIFLEIQRVGWFLAIDLEWQLMGSGHIALHRFSRFNPEAQGMGDSSPSESVGGRDNIVSLNRDQRLGKRDLKLLLDRLNGLEEYGMDVFPELVSMALAKSEPFTKPEGFVNGSFADIPFEQLETFQRAFDQLREATSQFGYLKADVKRDIRRLEELVAKDGVGRSEWTGFDLPAIRERLTAFVESFGRFSHELSRIRARDRWASVAELGLAEGELNDGDVIRAIGILTGQAKEIVATYQDLVDALETRDPIDRGNVVYLNPQSRALLESSQLVGLEADEREQTYLRLVRLAEMARDLRVLYYGNRGVGSVINTRGPEDYNEIEGIIDGASPLMETLRVLESDLRILTTALRFLRLSDQELIIEHRAEGIVKSQNLSQEIFDALQTHVQNLNPTDMNGQGCHLYLVDSHGKPSPPASNP